MKDFQEIHPKENLKASAIQNIFGYVLAPPDTFQKKSANHSIESLPNQRDKDIQAVFFSA